MKLIKEEFKYKESFLSILHSLDNDKIANLLLNKILHNSNDDTYIDVDYDNFQLVNFKFDKDKPENKIRLGKLVRNILNDESLINPDDTYVDEDDEDVKDKSKINFTDNDIEIFINKYRSLIDKKDVVFEIWEGEKIKDAYNSVNYHEKNIGSLNSSCMNGCFDLINFYSNSDKVKILILLKDDKIVARALLWSTDSGMFQDRIYCTKEHYVIMMEKWAHDKKCIKHSDIVNSLKYDDSYHLLNQMKINISNFNFDVKSKDVPYLDTFNKYIEDDNLLTNYIPETTYKKVYSLSTGTAHISSMLITFDPIKNDKKYIYHSNIWSDVYHDPITKEVYLDSECESLNYRNNLGDISTYFTIKSHKMIIDKIRNIEYIKSIEDFSSKETIFIVYLLNAIFQKIDFKMFNYERYYVDKRINLEYKISNTKKGIKFKIFKKTEHYGTLSIKITPSNTYFTFLNKNNILISECKADNLYDFFNLNIWRQLITFPNVEFQKNKKNNRIDGRQSIYKKRYF